MPLYQNIGATIRQHVASLLEYQEVDTPAHVLYAELAGGFACGTCRYVRPVNGSHGRCIILPNMVHLEHGCCAAWDYAERLLQVREAPAQ